MQNAEILTVPQAAELLGRSISTIYQMVFKKQIPYYKPNARTLYFKRQELIDWATFNRVTPTAELEQQVSTDLVTKRGR